MPMMNVRIVCMAVHDRLVLMLVRVRFNSVPSKGVRVLVMRIVTVTMGVDERIMCVFVLMALCEV
jgi:hypothetical protein